VVLFDPKRRCPRIFELDWRRSAGSASAKLVGAQPIRRLCHMTVDEELILEYAVWKILTSDGALIFDLVRSNEYRILELVVRGEMGDGLLKVDDL
jgi:hypothetical protein